MEGATHPLSIQIPDGLPRWLVEFARDAERETETLRENGALQAACARTALLHSLLAAASVWLNTEVDTAQAGHETGRCAESIRRAIRSGKIPDRRTSPKGPHRIRRGDLQRLAAAAGDPYDPIADAQDIARLRREL